MILNINQNSTRELHKQIAHLAFAHLSASSLVSFFFNRIISRASFILLFMNSVLSATLWCNAIFLAMLEYESKILVFFIGEDKYMVTNLPPNINFDKLLYQIMKIV